MQLGMLTAAQGEAVITALVHKSLAAAETRRSLAGPRGEDAIEAARRDILAGAAAWRDALRRDDLSIIAPLAADAAALAGFADPDQALVPDLLREDGFCAGDRTRLLARLDTDRPSRPATREPIVVQARAAETSPREPMRVMAGPLAGEPPRFVAAGSARGGPAATAPPSGSARAIVRCTRTGRATRDPFLRRNGDRRPCGRPQPRS